VWHERPKPFTGCAAPGLRSRELQIDNGKISVYKVILITLVLDEG
jgi:hypothetical protein